MFAALSEVSHDANGVIECGGIVRQRCAEPITVLVVMPPDGEKIPRHRALSLTPPSCGTTKVRLQEPLPPWKSFRNFYGRKQAGDWPAMRSI